MATDSSSEASGDIFSEARVATESLYLTRDTFFPANPQDKSSQLEHESQLALNLLDAIPAEKRQSQLERATYEFLKGKILDAFPEYLKNAEAHLSKAVKLNPTFAEAWLCLGDCIWKKGDLISAQNCYVVALNKLGPDKRLLRQLSMLLRQMSQGNGNAAEISEESIRHARDAVALDIKDGQSWYILGNAYLSSFFYTGSWDHDKISLSLKAYRNAERDEKLKFNPDLSFNSATVDMYEENYERALIGFEAASLRDPSLLAHEEVEKMVNLLEKLDNCVKNPGKAKKLSSLVSSLSEVNLNSSHKKVKVTDLLEGWNESVAVIGKVVLFIKNENKIPFYYLVCDSDLTCFVLSVFGLRSDTIKEEDQVTLMRPNYHNLDVSWKNKHYRFKSIRVDFMEQILVNGKPPAPHQCVRPSVLLEHKP